MLNANRSTTAADGHLTDLVYELLDAHVDTMRLVGDVSDDPGWAAHLDYLRGLQRIGREALARAACSSNN